MNRRNLGIALILISLLTVIVWGVSQFIQPILPDRLNSSLILFFAAILAVSGFLANLKDIIELVQKTPNTPYGHRQFGIMSEKIPAMASGDPVENAEGEDLSVFGMPTTHASIPELRRRLNRTFNDSQLDAFLLDYFIDIYDRLGRGMGKEEKITMLLEHCRRNENHYQTLSAYLDREEK